MCLPSQEKQELWKNLDILIHKVEVRCFWGGFAYIFSVFFFDLQVYWHLNLLFNNSNKSPGRHPGVFSGDQTWNDSFGGFVRWRDAEVSPNLFSDGGAERVWRCSVTLLFCSLADWRMKWGRSWLEWEALWSSRWKPETAGCLLEEQGWDTKACMRRLVSLFLLCVRKEKAIYFEKKGEKKNMIIDGKQISSSLFTCQLAVNDEKTNIYEGWPEFVEVGGCFPKTFGHNWHP